MNFPAGQGSSGSQAVAAGVVVVLLFMVILAVGTALIVVFLMRRRKRSTWNGSCGFGFLLGPICLHMLSIVCFSCKQVMKLSIVCKLS